MQCPLSTPTLICRVSRSPKTAGRAGCLGGTQYTPSKSYLAGHARPPAVVGAPRARRRYRPARTQRTRPIQTCRSARARAARLSRSRRGREEGTCDGRRPRCRRCERHCLCLYGFTFFFSKFQRSLSVAVDSERRWCACASSATAGPGPVQSSVFLSPRLVRLLVLSAASRIRDRGRESQPRTRGR